MAITAAICTSYKADLFNGAQLAADTYKAALFTSAATLDKTTTVYGAANEASGTGYTAAGATLNGFTVSTLGAWAILSFTDASWPSSTITARGVLIHNTTRTKACVVLDFGADKSSSAGTFTIDFGNATTSAASITFAATTLTRAAGDFVADGYQVGHTILTDDAINPGPYVITTVATTVLTCSAASMTAGGPRTVTIKEAVIYM